MYCEKCGRQIEGGSVFCPKCDAPINNSLETDGQTVDGIREANPSKITNSSIKTSTHKKRNIIIAGIATVIIVVLVAGALIFGPDIIESIKSKTSSSDKSDEYTTDETSEPESKYPTALTVGNVKISTVDYQYFYILMYYYTRNQANQYLQQDGQDVMGFDSTISPEKQNYPQTNDAGETITWADYLGNTAIDRAQKYAVLYREALALDKNKYSLTDEEQTIINEQIEQIRSTAAMHDITINAYLGKSYGEGIDETFIRNQLKKETIVTRFNEDKLNEFKVALTDARVQEIYETAKDAYDAVNLRVFYVENETGANAMLSRISDESSFLSTAASYNGAGYNADGETSYFYKTKTVLESSISKEAADWAFADERTAGDKAAFNTVNGYCVVWLKSPQFPTITVDVRHILLSFRADPSDTTAATTEEIAAAKLKAEQVYATWQAGNKTEASFGELAKTQSTDTGSKDNGGLYEDVTVGQMVKPFENWCFDPAKKPGDTGIIQTTYGYHVMYMVNNDPADFEYLASIRESKSAEDNDQYVKDLLTEKKYEMVKNEANISIARKSSLNLIETLINLEQSVIKPTF